MRTEKLYFQFRMLIMHLYLLKEKKQLRKYIMQNQQGTSSIQKKLLKTSKLNLLMKERIDCRSKKKNNQKDLDQDQEQLRMRTKSYRNKNLRKRTIKEIKMKKLNL